MKMGRYGIIYPGVLQLVGGFGPALAGRSDHRGIDVHSFRVIITTLERPCNESDCFLAQAEKRVVMNAHRHRDRGVLIVIQE